MCPRARVGSFPFQGGEYVLVLVFLFALKKRGDFDIKINHSVPFLGIPHARGWKEWWGGGVGEGLLHEPYVDRDFSPARISVCWVHLTVTYKNRIGKGWSNVFF